MTKILIALMVFTSFSFGALAMDYKEAKLVVWKKGEALYGEEFIAATEDIVDYLGTLERPTQNFKSFKYTCQVKSRTISPRTWSIGGPGTGTVSTYTYITHVYDLKDCVKQ